jgi:hypothetical protein
MATKDISDLQVLDAYEVAKKHRAANAGRDPFCMWPEDVLQEATGQHRKACFRAMERAEERGLIECGVSLHSGWVTGKGKDLLSSAPDVLHDEARLGALAGLSGHQKQNATRTTPPA